MYFTEFLLLMVSAVVITLLLMYLGEKIMLIITPKEIGPVIKILGSLIFTFGVIMILGFGFNMKISMNYFLVSGVIILLNKYWLGHFEKAQGQEEMKALSIYTESAEKFVE